GRRAWSSTLARTTVSIRCAFSCTARACSHSSPIPTAIVGSRPGVRRTESRASSSRSRWVKAPRPPSLPFPSATRAWRASLRARARWGETAVHSVTVRQVPLDDVVAQRGLVPDLVKIDTEGAELGVLRGAVDLLRTAHPMLVFESWRAAEPRRALWDMLDKHGYAIAAVDGSTPRPLTRAGFADAQPTNFVAEVLPGRVIHFARQ